MGIAGANQSKGVQKYRVLIFTAWKHTHLQPTQAHPTISPEIVPSLVHLVIPTPSFGKPITHSYTLLKSQLVILLIVNLHTPCFPLDLFSRVNKYIHILFSHNLTHHELIYVFTLPPNNFEFTLDLNKKCLLGLGEIFLYRFIKVMTSLNKDIVH